VGGCPRGPAAARPAPPLGPPGLGVIRVSLDTPAWLLALPAGALVWLLARRARGSALDRRGRAQRLATAARVVAVTSLVLALAGPRLGAAERGLDVAFLVDDSDSMGAARSDALAFVRQALDARQPGDRAAVGLFGRDAGLEHSLREDPPGAEPAVVVDGSASDLEQALRLGQGAVGSERRRRVVLLTDGRQTTGDVVTGARELAEGGVGLDVVTLQGGVPADVLIEAVAAPSSVRDGEAYDLTVTLRNTGAAAVEGVLAVTADGVEISRQPVSVAPGVSEVAVPRTAEGVGTVRYEARLQSGASPVAANDVGRAAVRVEGPPRVLVYQRTAGLADDLARALGAGGVPVDVRAGDAEPLPPLDALLDYDSVVLVDVPAAMLGEPGMATLQQYVRDAGHGLVATGGDESFTLGGYDGTPLEELLPVFASVTDPRRRPPVAEALVVDTSGSMAACHCSNPDVSGMGQMEQGGVNKTDISKEAVARAIGALEAQDVVGVLAFNTRSEWVIPLQNLPDAEAVDDGLARLHPDGNTDIDQAVRTAIDGLRDTDARLRHIVLFTDGFTETGSLVKVASEALDAGITLSVVATGEGPPETGEQLRRMAEAGGGRFYPGRDLSSIPNILALEVRMAVRPVVNEGSFLPLVTGTAPATEDLTESPPLLGYLATTSKPTARTLLRIGEERDPLLATWQAGLGTATAWTSDVAPRWSAQWVTWDRFAGFWSAVVKETFPAEEDLRGTLSATATGEGVRVRLDAAGTVPADAAATVSVTGPDGERVEAPLDRVELGAFEAVVGSGRAALDDEGVYAVSARLARGEEELYRGTVTAIRSYPAEYAASDGDPTLLQGAVAAAGGRLDPAAASVFDPAGLAPGAGTRPLWPWLAVLALILAPIDVGLRRLRLERGDWAKARAAVGAVLRRPAGGARPVAERTAAADALLAAKRRARAGPEGPPSDQP